MQWYNTNRTYNHTRSFIHTNITYFISFHSSKASDTLTDFSKSTVNITAPLLRPNQYAITSVALTCGFEFCRSEFVGVICYMLWSEIKLNLNGICMLGSPNSTWNDYYYYYYFMKCTIRCHFWLSKGQCLCSRKAAVIYTVNVISTFEEIQESSLLLASHNL